MAVTVKHVARRRRRKIETKTILDLDFTGVSLASTFLSISKGDTLNKHLSTKSITVTFVR